MKTDHIIKDIAIGAGFAAVYVALTYALVPLSYGPIQFRISEILMLFPFWNKRFILPAIIGVAIANLFSPLGAIDIVTGVVIAVITYTTIIWIRNKVADVILYSLLCGILVGLEITYVDKTPYIINFLTVTAGQLGVCLLGLFVIRIMNHNDYIRNLLFE
jgi:uncharacterized membrane protein